MVCRTRRFAKEKICSADLRHRCDILTRDLNAPGLNDIVPPITFTPIKARTPCAITTLRGSSRFDSVNTEERPTHSVVVRRDNNLLNLDQGNVFVRIFRGPSPGTAILLRVLDIDIKDEDPNYIEIMATERGVETQKAAEA